MRQPHQSQDPWCQFFQMHSCSRIFWYRGTRLREMSPWMYLMWDSYFLHGLPWEVLSEQKQLMFWEMLDSLDGEGAAKTHLQALLLRLPDMQPVRRVFDLQCFWVQEAKPQELKVSTSEGILWRQELCLQEMSLFMPGLQDPIRLQWVHWGILLWALWVAVRSSGEPV